MKLKKIIDLFGDSKIKNVYVLKVSQFHKLKNHSKNKMIPKNILSKIKIKHVDVIYFLEIICAVNFSYILFLFELRLFNFFFEYQFEYYFKNVKFITYIFICIMIFFSVYFYKRHPVRKIEIKNIDGNQKYKYIKIIDFYRILLLLFSISTFIIFVLFSVIFNIIFLYFGIIMYIFFYILV